MSIPPAYRAAESMEQFLGPPLGERTPFSFCRAVALDERDEYPEEACALLQQWGFAYYCIPRELGGGMTSFEELLALLRVVSRRDLTVAIALGQTYLGAVHVWIGGSPEQKRLVAAAIERGRQLAFALTERAHGSDVLASETEARAVAGGYLLSGEKWLINNGTRAAILTLFARTDPAGGPRGFSLLLCEKDRLDRSAYRHLDKVKTLGIRGADISGVRFDRCLLGEDALVGRAGHGLEIGLKGLMVTRTLCAGFSLGAADTALRVALRFALARNLYGSPVFDLPHASDLLVGCFLDLLACDCVAVAANRGLHVAPEQFSVWSAVVKYFVPTTVERIIHRLSVVLGARYYLREDFCAGIFQKMVRDNAVVSLFDGSTVINLRAIVLQLRHLYAYQQKADGDDETLRRRLAQTFSLGEPLPPVEFARLDLSNKGRDDVMQGLKAAQVMLRRLQREAESDAGVLAALAGYAESMLEEIRGHGELAAEWAAGGGEAVNQSPGMFRLSQRYCVLHAASACLLMWLHNRKLLGEFFAGGRWLALWLHQTLPASPPSPPPADGETVARELLRLYHADRLFSAVPFQLAREDKTTAL